MTTNEVAVLEKAPAAGAQIKAGLEKMRPQFAVSLPRHISAERFERVIMTALNLNPDLASADRRSLFNAVSRAAQDGLMPDGREGALVTFKDSSGKKMVQWLPMVGGIIKKIRQSGEIASIGAKLVYQSEIDAGRFTYAIRDGVESYDHTPMLWGDRGEKVLVYAWAKFKSGEVQYHFVHRDDVMKRKSASRVKSDIGPWAKWEDEMWLKTAVRGLARYLPLSAEIMTTLERDEEPSAFARLKDTAVQSIGAAAAQLSAPDDDDGAAEGDEPEAQALAAEPMPQRSDYRAAKDGEA